VVALIILFITFFGLFEFVDRTFVVVRFQGLDNLSELWEAYASVYQDEFRPEALHGE
jgi:hypothetical protein